MRAREPRGDPRAGLGGVSRASIHGDGEEYRWSGCRDARREFGHGGMASA